MQLKYFIANTNLIVINFTLQFEQRTTERKPAFSSVNLFDFTHFNNCVRLYNYNTNTNGILLTKLISIN